MINVPPAGSESGTPIHQSSPEYQKSSPRHSSNSRILTPTPQTHINIRLGIHMFTTHWRLFCTLTLDTVANFCSQIRIKWKNSYPVNNNCKSRIRPKKDRIRPKKDRNRIPELGALLVVTGKHFLFPFGTNGERKKLFILFWSDSDTKIKYNCACMTRSKNLPYRFSYT